MSRLKKYINNVNPSTAIPFAGLVLVIVFFTVISGGKLLMRSNLIIIMNQVFTTLVVSMGAVFLYAHGGVDFSLGSVMALAGLLGAMAVRVTGNILLVLPVCIIVAVICCMTTGFITLAIGIPAFVGSMAMDYIAAGLVTSLVNAQGISVPEVLYTADSWTIKIITLVVLIAIMVWTFEYTRVGKYNKAIGANPVAAHHNGINTTKYRFIAYILCGFATGVAGFFSLCRTGSVSSTTGNGLAMDVMTALVLGALPLSGGPKAKMRCAIIGAVIVALITNGLVISGVNASYTEGVRGIIFLVVVYFSHTRKKEDLYD